MTATTASSRSPSSASLRARSGGVVEPDLSSAPDDSAVSS
jgi:hypothetical protein